VGASPFPRHWIYDHTGTLVAKTGLVDFARWRRGAFGRHTPWGSEDSPALVIAVETALERRLSRLVIDARPSFRSLKRGATLVEQGDPGSELFLLFEGVLAVEVDGRVVTEVGPGAIVGEMAVLEHDVMLVCAVPARLRDRGELLAALAATLGADPAQLAARLERGIAETAAVTVARCPWTGSARSSRGCARSRASASCAGGHGGRLRAGGPPPCGRSPAAASPWCLRAWWIGKRWPSWQRAGRPSLHDRGRAAARAGPSPAGRGGLPSRHVRGSASKNPLLRSSPCAAEARG
jgi:CRP-like cAMP-binding protein